MRVIFLEYLWHKKIVLLIVIEKVLLNWKVISLEAQKIGFMEASVGQEQFPRRPAVRVL